jgi:carboxylesterase
MTQNPYLKNPHLAGDDFFWQGNQIGILLIHGFTATTAEVRLLAEKLHAAGYTTAGPLLPGHGTHPDDLNRATWSMWVEKVKQAYQELASQCERIYVGGESMGGLLTLELARQHPEIAGLFLFAPAIKVYNSHLPWLARIGWPFIKYFNKKGKDDSLPWKGYTVNPVKAGVQLHKLQIRVRRNLREIKQPVVVFTGEFDRTIAPISAQIILDNVSSQVRNHYHMQHSGHCVILDQELDEIAEDVLGFIQSGFGDQNSLQL